MTDDLNTGSLLTDKGYFRWLLKIIDQYRLLYELVYHFIYYHLFNTTSFLSILQMFFFCCYINRSWRNSLHLFFLKVFKREHKITDSRQFKLKEVDELRVTRNGEMM